MTRRRPIELHGRVRHIDGREGVVMGLGVLVSWGSTHVTECDVAWDDGTRRMELPGYLEALSADKLTA